jgi:N-acyl homoserine lactone hydrolase
MSSSSATPAQLPLPGGQPNATVTLYPMLCGEMSGPPGWFERDSGPGATLKALGIGVGKDQLTRVPIIAFLVEHPSAGAILIDTGFHRSVIDKPRENLGLIGALMTRDLRMGPEQTVVAQLRTRGIDPAEVRLILMTHLHFDHASALADFPGATVLVSKPEWNAAHQPAGALAGYPKNQLDPRLTYRTIDFDAQQAHPHKSFGQALDLFGDGSIVFVFTPGHSAGHMSIILRLNAREAFIAGDAIYTMATLREGRRPWRSQNKDAFEHSLQAIGTYDREHPDAVIIPGHDIAHWRQLNESYA